MFIFIPRPGVRLCNLRFVEGTMNSVVSLPTLKVLQRPPRLALSRSTLDI